MENFNLHKEDQEAEVKVPRTGRKKDLKRETEKDSPKVRDNY